MRMKVSIAAIVLACVLGAVGNVAQIPATVAQSLDRYDLAREVTLVGTVASYTANSTSVPFGPRVSLQTSSGTVNVHLGDARLLAANQFTIQPGDTLRIIGENVAIAGKTQFLARVVQDGMHALEVRSARGFPLTCQGPNDSSSAGRKHGEVL